MADHRSGRAAGRILSAWEALAAEVGLALFEAVSEPGRLRLSRAIGLSQRVTVRFRQLEYRLGEERGLVGLVAESGRPLYVPECHQEPRWIEVGPPVRSVYLVPVPSFRRTPCVVSLISTRDGGLSPEERGLFDVIVQLALWAEEREGELSARVRELEQALQQMAFGLERLGVWTPTRHREIPEELREALSALTPREFEVLGGMKAGLRVGTIARQLSISANTVRNHLKSIFRKLDVGSQGELIERLGADASPGWAPFEASAVPRVDPA